jgi:hypothetical protein
MEIGDRLRELGCVRTGYIGDGVYVGYDGYQVWLLTQRSEGIHEIALEPRAISDLVRYVHTIEIEKSKPIKEAE